MPIQRKISSLLTLLACAFHTAKEVIHISFLSACGKTSAVDNALQTWSHSLLNSLAVRWRVSNPYQVTLQPGQKYILMSNHASLMDIPLIFAAFPDNRVRMLAKKELFRIPFFGSAMKRAGFPSIDRKNTEQAIRDLARVKEQMQEGIIPWIAPEGTRSRDGHLQHFKPGGFLLALQTEATVLPIAIIGAASIIPPDTFNLNLNQEVEIILLPPVNAKDYSIETRKKFIADVRGSIAEALGTQS